jgi:N-acyl homoserine lactone hydrolase
MMRLLAAAVVALARLVQLVAQQKTAPPKSMRLYVFDCGVINVNRAGTERYKVTPEEVGETRFSVPCFLVAHPKGTLMWDLGISSGRYR